MKSYLILLNLFAATTVFSSPVRTVDELVAAVRDGREGSAIDLVNNPGRGVVWINEPYSNLDIRNNHIVTRTTTTPRTEGLFGFNAQSDFATIRVRNNIIECIGQTRPLFRGEKNCPTEVTNNRLSNVSDLERYANGPTKEVAGLETPLSFACGVHDEVTVMGWKATATAR